MRVVNEGSALPLTFRLFDADTVATTPTTLRYRIDCETTGKELLGWTSVSAASSVSLTVSGTINAIQNRTNAYETKALTVSVDAGLSTVLNDKYAWRVRNLNGVS